MRHRYRDDYVDERDERKVSYKIKKHPYQTAGVVGVVLFSIYVAVVTITDGGNTQSRNVHYCHSESNTIAAYVDGSNIFSEIDEKTVEEITTFEESKALIVEKPQDKDLSLVQNIKIEPEIDSSEAVQGYKSEVVQDSEQVQGLLDSGLTETDKTEFDHKEDQIFSSLEKELKTNTNSNSDNELAGLASEQLRVANTEAAVARKEAREVERRNEELRRRIDELEAGIPYEKMEDLIGRRGSGLRMNHQLMDPDRAVIFSLYGPVEDEVLGQIYLPNYREGRAFIVPENGPMPRLVRANDDIVIPEGFTPQLHPDMRCERTGMLFLVFAKADALIEYMISSR